MGQDESGLNSMNNNKTLFQKISILVYVWAPIVLMPSVCLASDVSKLTLHEALANMIKHHPLLKVNRLEASRSQLRSKIVEGQLAWSVKGQAQNSHDLSFLGTPSDRTDISAGLEKTWGFGGRVNLDATYGYEDSETTISPVYPNPSRSTNLDLSYRQPLARGWGNPSYEQGLVEAEAAEKIALANWQETRDGLGENLVELFFVIARINAQIRNAESGIERSRRLKKYVLGNIRLGIAEEKDLLQAEAQLSAGLAERQRLQTQWEVQQLSLNRIAGLPPPLRFSPVVPASGDQSEPGLDVVLPKSIANSYAIKRSEARVLQANAAIEKGKDQTKDKLDLVLSGGQRRLTGESSAGDIDETDYASLVRLEYRRTLNRDGLEAVLTDAQLQRSIAYQEIEAYKLDLQYRLTSLVSEYRENRLLLDRNKDRQKKERLKYREAEERYQSGREITSILIQFENELRAAELLVLEREIEIQRILARINLLSGNMWNGIEMPELLPEQSVEGNEK